MHLDRPHGEKGPTRLTLPLALALAVLGAREGPAMASLMVQATLVELPRSPPCTEKEIVSVTVRYRVERVIQGELASKELLVVHRCPEIPRGPSRYGRGEARTMRPGQVHLLTLKQLEPPLGPRVQDRFGDDPQPRYQALVTDPGPRPPCIAVVVSGGGGTVHRLDFDAEAVTVGRDPASDVLLNDPQVADRQLVLKVAGERVMVVDLAPGSRMRINGQRVRNPRRITYQDRITVGPYLLRVALFLGGEKDE